MAIPSGWRCLRNGTASYEELIRSENSSPWQRRGIPAHSVFLVCSKLSGEVRISELSEEIILMLRKHARSYVNFTAAERIPGPRRENSNVVGQADGRFNQQNGTAKAHPSRSVFTSVQSLCLKTRKLSAHRLHSRQQTRSVVAHLLHASFLNGKANT